MFYTSCHDFLNSDLTIKQESLYQILAYIGKIYEIIIPILYTNISVLLLIYQTFIHVLKHIMHCPFNSVKENNYV